jgi:voltage-gated potassium channel
MNPRAEAMARRFQVPMLIASALVIPSMIIENSHPAQPWSTVGVFLDWGIWLTFVAEFVAMLTVVDDRKRWLIRHPVDVIVVFLTPPFLSQFFRSIILLRLLRLLRLGPLARYAFTLEGIRYASILMLLVILAGGAAFDSIEVKQGFGNGVYMAVNIATTLGFGPQPTTDAGKWIAVLLVFTGAAFLALLTGAIAERFTTARRSETDALTERIESTTEDVLVELRALGERLAALEAAVADRTPPAT